DPAEADLFAFPFVTLHLSLGRHGQHDFLRIDSVENRAAHLLRQIFPTRFEREIQHLPEAVHHPTIPCVRVILEGLTHKATTSDATLRIGDEQLRVCKLVHTKAATCPACALGIVED